MDTASETVLTAEKIFAMRLREIDAYRYKPLKPNSKRIMLLTLLPGSFNSPMRILIKVVELTKKKTPKYEAFSYTRGSTDNSVDIMVGRKLLPVIQNLA